MYNLTRALALTSMMLVSTFTYGQLDAPQFRHLSRSNGLTSNNVTCFAQTSDGFLWIGTTDGLNRFDGYSFTAFRHDSQDPHSLSDNHITALHTDYHGRLWVGTEAKGLNLYDPRSGSFIRFPHKDYDQSSLSNYFITSIAEDTQQRLWVGTIMGLNLYQESNQAFKRYFHETEVMLDAQALKHMDAAKLSPDVLRHLAPLSGKKFANYAQFQVALESHLGRDTAARYSKKILKWASRRSHADHIRVLAIDQKGCFYLGYENEGLGYFNPYSNHLQAVDLPHGIGPVSSLLIHEGRLWVGDKRGNLVILDIADQSWRSVYLPTDPSSVDVLYMDESATIWVGTDEGLLAMDTLGNLSNAVQHDSSDPWSLSTTAVKAIFEDREHNLWVATAQGGLNLYVKHTPFKFITHRAHAGVGLSKNSVTAVLEDSHSNLWIGYYTGGIDQQTTDHTTTYCDSQGTLAPGTVFEIYEDQKGRIWASTYEGGLQRLNPQSKQFEPVSLHFEPQKDAPKADIRAIDEDDSGRLWFALHGQGIACYDPDEDSLKVYRADYLNWRNSLANDWVYTLFVTSQNQVWIGSVWGVSVFDMSTGQFVTFNDQNSNLSHNQVRVILEDRDGNIWLGTESGLNLSHVESPGEFTVFSTDQGLADNNIVEIQQDRLGTVWVATKNGLSRYVKADGRFLNYTDHHIFLQNELFAGAGAAGHSNTLYFGGNEGLVSFDPTLLKADSLEIPLIIDAVQVMTDGKALVLPTHNASDQMELAYDQNMINFSYVGIYLKNPRNLQYAYRLEGLENEWNEMGLNREAHYTNLAPGKYTFRVRVKKHLDEQEAELKLTIAPPFWRSTSAYAIYLIMLVLLVVLYRKILLRRERHKHSLKMKEFKAKERTNMDAMKIRFLTNISHEFRSPLTLIKEPVDCLLNNGELIDLSTRKSYLALVSRNTRRLLRLINQFLDLSELDAGCMKLQVQNYDIVKFCRNVSDAFIYQADKNNIDYAFESNVGQYNAYFDADKLEKILYNLLSNAFKFTPNGGSVTLQLCLDTVDSDDVIANIKVRDNGLGMAPGEVQSMFERFHYGRDTTTPHLGTGIGLSLVNQLVKVHRGKIKVNSKEQEGTCVSIHLPVSQKYYAPKEFTKANLDVEEIAGDVRAMLCDDFSPLPPLPVTRAKSKILIVDDHDDLRWFIGKNLSPHFQIREAVNAAEALRILDDFQPDIMLTDVMMRGQDGMSFCQQIKSDPLTAHILVVILTARSKAEDAISAMSCGADDYIQKPFSMRLLMSKLLNMVDTKKNLKLHLIHTNHTIDSDKATKVTNGFERTLYSSIEHHLTNPELGPEMLAEILNLSRSQLYKRVKQLSGRSVSILIREFRLKKAAGLLLKEDLTVAEVAYKVGFNDPGYFTRCFKAHFGKSPTTYIKL